MIDKLQNENTKLKEFAQKVLEQWEEELDRLRAEIRRSAETRKVYEENLKLCKWQI